MTNPTLRRALACAERGWPVFPCQPEQKTPATPNGHLDATTDPARIHNWFERRPELNLAVATGAPGPDVLDIDTDFATGSGFPALRQLHAARLIYGPGASFRTPRGGLHYYFAGSQRRSEHLSASHVNLLAAGGYVIIPPSQINGTPYWRMRTMYRDDVLDWHAVAELLEPSRERGRPPAEKRVSPPARALTRLAQRSARSSTPLSTQTRPLLRHAPTEPTKRADTTDGPVLPRGCDPVIHKPRSARR